MKLRNIGEDEFMKLRNTGEDEFIKRQSDERLSL